MARSRRTSLEYAVLRWWRSYRPIGWSLKQHLLNPTVNVLWRSDHRLAREAAKLAVTR